MSAQYARRMPRIASSVIVSVSERWRNALRRPGSAFVLALIAAVGDVPAVDVEQTEFAQVVGITVGQPDRELVAGFVHLRESQSLEPRREVVDMGSRCGLIPVEVRLAN